MLTHLISRYHWHSKIQEGPEVPYLCAVMACGRSFAGGEEGGVCGTITESLVDCRDCLRRAESTNELAGRAGHSLNSGVGNFTENFILCRMAVL